jgi:hypothetical protein
MTTYKKSVNIDAVSDKEATELALAMLEIMKTVRNRTSTKDFLAFAEALKNTPSLVDKARFFM